MFVSDLQWRNVFKRLLQKQGTMNLSQKLETLSLNERKELFDLNVVSEEELKQHFGLSDRLAKRIIERRKTLETFTSVEDLRSIPGIGPKKYEKLQQRLFVNEEDESLSGLPTHTQQISLLDPAGNHIASTFLLLSSTISQMA